MNELSLTLVELLLLREALRSNRKMEEQEFVFGRGGLIDMEVLCRGIETSLLLERRIQVLIESAEAMEIR